MAKKIDALSIFGEAEDYLKKTHAMDKLGFSRHTFEKDKLIPLAVVNGFPNKRTDFYEVIEDIYNVINVQVVTLSYHALLVLNLFQPHISVRHFKSFVINRTKDSLLSPMKRIIDKLENIDKNISGINYTPIK